MQILKSNRLRYLGFFSVLAALPRVAQERGTLPKEIAGTLAVRVAMGFDGLAALQQQLRISLWLMLIASRGLRETVARVLCVSVMALQGCGVDAATTGVTVTSIAYDIASPDPSIAWVDNNELIFVGKKSNSDPKKGSSL